MLRPCLVLCTLLATQAPSEARATPCDGEQTLAAMDARLNAAQDLKLTIEILNEVPGKADRTLRMRVQTQGAKRFTEFLAPGDVKGTKVLTLSRSKMYVYLPAYQKVRRITSHASDQGFMGTTLSQSDMSTTHYGKVYLATGCEREGEHLIVDAERRAGAEVAYARVQLKLSAQKLLPLEMKYFSATGKHVKTETRGSYECLGDFCNPNVITMVDHTRLAQTKLNTLSWEMDSGISASVFSRRHLQRAR